MSDAASVHIVAPGIDRPVPSGWAAAVAATPGVTVLGDAEARLGSLRVTADAAAAARLRALFGGALRVEEVRPRTGD